MLIGLCAVQAVSVRAEEYIANGFCNVDPASNRKLLYSIDTNGELAFWCEEIGKNYWDGYDEITADGPFPLYMDEYRGVNEEVVPGADYSTFDLVPWAEYLDQIRSVDLTNVRNIGRYAFGDLPNLKYLRIPMDVGSIAGKAFMGSTNLQTIQMDRELPLGLNEDALWIDELEGEPIQVPTIIVPYGCEGYYIDESPWNKSAIVPIAGDIGETHWTVNNRSDSLGGGLGLSIFTYATEEGEADQIPDRVDGEPMPWDVVGDKIIDLLMSGYISYVGREVFASFGNLETILFNGSGHALDSMHAAAFSPQSMPWKFAFGTGDDDGPLVPPLVIGANEDIVGSLTETWGSNTVLFVPDATVLIDDEPVRCVDLYRNDPFWGRVFNRITDRTVEVEKGTFGEVLLNWLPLENAQAYVLTIRALDGDQWRDTTITIPATGRQGLVNWDEISESPSNGLPARRAPQDNDGHGGLTLTISIPPSSGTAHNKDVAVSVKGMKPNTQYEFTREVVQEGQVNARMSKGGAFSVSSTTDLEQTVGSNQRPRVYDMTGRYLGEQMQQLPAGVYIVEKGGKRTTIVRSR